ncbi:hypothetical protein RDI58_019910 [Solanum bulbocastanum]|uniref:Uncharacterized protein n=1 Tax=Solanum bulbocastanum TaxID=147425 RepID=A0AAN8T656_SOLBU
MNGYKAMVSYLFEVRSLHVLQTYLLHTIIQNEMYEMALHLFNKDRKLANSLKELILQRGESYLAWPGGVLPAKYVLEKHVSLLLEELWAECQRSAEDKLLELLEKESLLYSAARAGNIELLVVVIHSRPELIWQPDYQNWTIFHLGGRAGQPLHKQKTGQMLIIMMNSLNHNNSCFKRLDSLLRDVRMDKNIMMKMIELSNGTASNMKKTVNPFSYSNIGIPLSLLLPPGTGSQQQTPSWQSKLQQSYKNSQRLSSTFSLLLVIACALV